MSYYADYILTREHARKTPHSSWMDICDAWLAKERDRYRYRRGQLAELKETHGCGYRPTVEAVRL